MTGVGWLDARLRFLCDVEDVSAAPARYAGDPQGLIRHYLGRGWMITGTGP